MGAGITLRQPRFGGEGGQFRGGRLVALKEQFQARAAQGEGAEPFRFGARIRDAGGRKAGGGVGDERPRLSGRSFAPTVTLTDTPTAVPTHTATPLPTNTSTQTDTPTATATSTAVATATATNTRTATDTRASRNCGTWRPSGSR